MAPAPSPSPVQAPLTTAQAKRVAVQAQLVAADAPGLRLEKAPMDVFEKQLDQCLSNRRKPLATAGSLLSRGEQATPSYRQIRAVTIVARDATVVAADLERMAGPDGLVCPRAGYDYLLGDVLEKRGLTLKDLSVEAASVPPPAGASRVVGYTLRATHTVRGRRLVYYNHTVRAGVGAAEVVFSISQRSGPPPRAEIERLLGVLVERARAAQS